MMTTGQNNLTSGQHHQKMDGFNVQCVCMHACVCVCVCMCVCMCMCLCVCVSAPKAINN